VTTGPCGNEGFPTPELSLPPTHVAPQLPATKTSETETKE